MSKEEELAKRFAPEHITANLPTDLDVAKKEIQEVATPKKPDPVVTPKTNLRSNREYPFWIDWTSPSGKNYQGEFVNRVLSLGDKASAGVLRAKLGGGMPVSSLDDMTIEVNLIIAHLTFSLIKKPDWAADLRSLDELALLQVIYEEVASHEATFFGYIQDKEGSGK